MPSTSTLYIMLGIFVLYTHLGVKDVPCMPYMHLNALTAQQLNQRRRHWPLLLIVQWQMHADRARMYITLDTLLQAIQGNICMYL